MDKETYYIKLQSLVDRVTSLKKEIEISNDNEKVIYLKLAVKKLYEEIRLLMENNKY